MKKVRLLLFASLFAFVSLGLNAQDIHFSQFNLSPLNLNPAMTGVMNSEIRLTANYRNQWSSVLKDNSFNTYSVSYDQRIPVGRNDYAGIGGTFWGDQAGSADFQTVTGKISASYAKKMGGSRGTSHYLVLGGEIGLAQRSLDFLKLRWGSQHDNKGGFNPNLSSGETNLTNDNFLFADVAAGLLWFSVLDENNNFFIGAAFNHLNRANQSFFDGEQDFVFSRFTIHGGGEFELTDKVSLVPGFIGMKQGPSFLLNAGANLKFRLGNGRSHGDDFQAFHLGTWVRVANNVGSGIITDAFILQTRFDFNQFTLGFAYDINVSALKPASNNNGAFEFAMQYRFGDSKRKGVYCPHF